MKLPIIALAATTTLAFSQGPLLPPGAPEPTQKSLQEIWNKIGVLEAQNTTLQAQNTSIQAQNQLLTSLLGSAGVNFGWNIKTVDAVGFTGTYTSLAFSLDGQPAISYYDITNGDLRFARFNGRIWATTTVDAAGETGDFTSLAFGPDGQRAISYHDRTNGDLKFARKGLFPPAP